MTRPERFDAATGSVAPLPIPLPLQNVVVDDRQLLTVPWVSFFQWILNVGTRTFVTGTHAERIDDKNDPAQYRPGTWFWETDRTVLYQVRVIAGEPQWVYVLGTMSGTLTPDQRPTDLGPFDAAFQFLASDTGQSYFWDGTAWVDVTAYPYTVYGTHAERLAQPVDETADGALWAETDRDNTLYQLQSGVWWFIAGTMFGTLIPDERPTDLGVHDAGFTFRTSVPPAREFMWSQTAWVEITPIGGAAFLTHPNVVTKVGATAGGIVEGGITDESAANSDCLHITSAGNVGIGTATAPGKLTIGDGTSAMSGVNLLKVNGWGGLYQRWDTGIPGRPNWGLAREYAAAGDCGFLRSSVANGTPDTTALYMTGGGDVGIGITSLGYKFQVVVDSAGKPATSTWSVVSDLRLKQNVEAVEDDSLAILRNLDWVRYEYNGQASTPKGLKAIGLVAQDLAEHLPEAVRSTRTRLIETDADEADVLAIDYHYILVHSARAIQQLEAEIQSLRAMLEK
jgi:Chaperone of endosialidase